MNEVFPVLGGITVGLVTFAMRGVWLKAIGVGILGVGFGAAASWISGELAASWFYLIVDTAQVIVVAILTGVLVRARLRHRARSSAR